MPDNEIINDSTGINDNVPPNNDNPTENGTDIPVDDDNPIENSTETPDESESADMTDNGAELPDEDEKMPIIFPDNGLEDDFPDEVSADEVSADEQEPEQKTELEQKPEQESQPEESTEEKTEEQTEEQPEEQAKKKLWDTLKEAFSKFTIRSKTEKDVEKDVKAEIVESQNQGLKPVSEEKQPEEKQLSPEEIMKIDACTAIMMAHLEKYNIRYNSQTVKGIVQAALTGYAVALGSNRPLGDLRDANTTKRLISDVMNGITNDIQNRFGDQPIKVTTTVSFGKDEVRTIAKQMANILRVPNDDDHLGHSIKTTLDEIPEIKVPLTVSYMELLEERKKHEATIKKNDKLIADLNTKIDERKESLDEAKEKFKAETGLDYDEITASKAPNTPDTNDTPDYSKILKPEYSELFEQCVFLSSDLNRLNKTLADEKGLDLPDIKDDDKKIRDMEEQLQKLGVSGITEFINKLNPITVSSEEIPAPENSPSSTLEEALADVGKKEKVPDEQPKADDATEQPAPEAATATLTDVEKHNDAPATEQPTPATPSDPTPEAATEEATIPDEQHKADAAEESASAAEESASAAEESASAAEESASAAEETASATAEQLKVNDNAQSEEKSDSDDLESAPATSPTDDQDQNSEKPADATTPESDENRESKGTKRPETMAKDGRDLTVNDAGSKAAAEAEAARKAAIPGEGEKRDNGHRNKTIK